MGLFNRSSKKKSGGGAKTGQSYDGTSLMSGDTLGEALMGQVAKCLKCGNIITFQDGASLAMKRGYSMKVMCKKCKSVFSVQLTPHSMTLYN